MMGAEEHNHITQEILPPGECYSCDRYHALHPSREASELRNVIYGTLDSWEDFGAAHAHSYLLQEAQARGIDRYENE
jgi:hypothetical protein